MKINPVALFALYLFANIGLFHVVHTAEIIPANWSINLFWGSFIASFGAVFMFARSPQHDQL